MPAAALPSKDRKTGQSIKKPILFILVIKISPDDKNKDT
jgi:hypothetical protein